MPNPVRLLSPASIGQQKSRHENSLLLFPHSLPMSHPRASSHEAQTSWPAELPVPLPCNHFFYALSMIMAEYVGVPCSYQQTLQIRVITNNCNNLVIITKLPKSESAADFSPQKADPNRKQVVWQESYNYTTCKHGVLYVNEYISFHCLRGTGLGRPQALHIPPGLCLLPSFPCSPFCMSPAVLLSSSL